MQKGMQRQWGCTTWAADAIQRTSGVAQCLLLPSPPRLWAACTYWGHWRDWGWGNLPSVLHILTRAVISPQLPVVPVDIWAENRRTQGWVYSLYSHWGQQTAWAGTPHLQQYLHALPQAGVYHGPSWENSVLTRMAKTGFSPALSPAAQCPGLS